MYRWIVGLVAALLLAPAARAWAFMPWNGPIRSELTSEEWFFIDLDGDGQRDSVVVTFFLKERPGMGGLQRVVVRARGHELQLLGESILPEVNVVDLDTADVRKELQFSEDGPSDDPEVAFVALCGDSLALLGTLGTLQGQAQLFGDGMIRAEVRGGVLHTYSYTQWFVLRTPNRIEPVGQALHPMRTPVRLLGPLTLLRSPRSGEVAFRLKAGARADLWATDGKQWVMLRDAAGRTGWFEVEEYGWVKEGHRHGPEVFDGLLIVD